MPLLTSAIHTVITHCHLLHLSKLCSVIIFSGTLSQPSETQQQDHQRHCHVLMFSNNQPLSPKPFLPSLCSIESFQIHSVPNIHREPLHSCRRLFLYLTFYCTSLGVIVFVNETWWTVPGYGCGSAGLWLSCKYKRECCWGWKIWESQSQVHGLNPLFNNCVMFHVSFALSDCALQSHDVKMKEITKRDEPYS